METSWNDEPSTRNDGEASDADSDLEELEGNIAKFNESVREFLASQKDDDGSSQAIRGGPRGRGGVRGPRKAAKPRGDITARLSKVNQAFLSGEYTVALDLAFEVIRINAETHQAWITVASIFREQGDVSKALSAMIYAAHLRPKDVSGWLQCASYALETMFDEEAENLQKARVCYSAALRADHFNLEARMGKGMVCHRQGHLSAAISEYKFVLKRSPHDLETVRKLAEACADSKHPGNVVPNAIAAYEAYFDHEKANPAYHMSSPPWQDVGIYVDLFASTNRYFDAIRGLKTLSRWVLGRESEGYWENWQDDDREWDADHERRDAVPEFSSSRSDPSLYGQGLPHDLRARLAIYRLRLKNEPEAMTHLLWFDPSSELTKEFAADFPDLVFDIAEALAFCENPSSAIRYYELLRDLPGGNDAAISLQLGRCYIMKGEPAIAEEHLLAAIDADEDNIEARIELANMYEKAREEEEALILAAEAMALREARGQDAGDGYDVANQQSGSTVPQDNRLPRRRDALHQRGQAKLRLNHDAVKSIIPRRYRPKRLANADKRRKDEQARALKLTEQYEVVRRLRQQINDGREDLLPAWMASSKELVDDFRSLKKFYTWEKYLHFLGSKGTMQQQSESEQPKNELSQMYERLARTLAPHAGNEGRDDFTRKQDNHQGISFDKWLDLFLEYAIGLAIAQRRDEAYQVCEAARDSTAFQAPEHGFIIHVAWSVCAVYTSDEEKCVSTARQLMRDGAMSDSYRMFALLSCLCQSPVSWYTSGPAQKYLLRQIKAMDDAYESSHGERAVGDVEGEALDACVLMLYGHILFTSTSYTYALGYFLRAWALDSDNKMVNLSLGLAYVHYGLKRQSTNRQYLLLQGQSFLSRYADLNHNSDGRRTPGSSAEAHYNIGRLFQLLGINSLAHEYYSKARKATANAEEHEDIKSISLNNELMALLNIRNNQRALTLLKEHIKL